MVGRELIAGAVSRQHTAPSAQVGKADWQAVQQGPPWAVDAWGLGCLIQEVYRGAVLTRTEELRDTSSIPKSVLSVRLCFELDS